MPHVPMSVSRKDDKPFFVLIACFLFLQTWYSLQIGHESARSFPFSPPTMEGLADARNTTTTTPSITTQNHDAWNERTLATEVAAEAARQRQDGDGFAHCFYRNYPKTGLYSGLPFVAEVFASYDHESVFVVVESHYGCHKEFQKAHNFFRTNKRSVTFDCIFEYDGSRTVSDPVHRHAVDSRMGYALIRCPLPTHIRHSIPISGSTFTRAFLTLQSKHDLVTGRDITHRRKRLSHLPICSHAWPSETKAIRVGPTKKYKTSIMTRVALSYERGLDNQQLSTNQRDFVQWIEYHIAIGVEHFYIYDDSSHSHNSTIFQWCQHYMAQGILTYVHYPKDDMVCNTGGRARFYSAQMIASNAALRRFENETEWMGHWDIDEYLVINNKKVGGDLSSPVMFSSLSKNGTSSLLHDFFSQRDAVQDSKADELTFSAFVFGPCQDDKDTPYSSNVLSSLPLTHRHCYVEDKNVKALYRASTILYFKVHTSRFRMDNRVTKKLQVPANSAYIAHFRSGKAAGTNFPNTTHDLDGWIEYLDSKLKERLDGGP